MRLQKDSIGSIDIYNEEIFWRSPINTAYRSVGLQKGREENGCVIGEVKTAAPDSDHLSFAPSWFHQLCVMNWARLKELLDCLQCHSHSAHSIQTAGSGSALPITGECGTLCNDPLSTYQTPLSAGYSSSYLPRIYTFQLDLRFPLYRQRWSYQGNSNTTCRVKLDRKCSWPSTFDLCLNPTFSLIPFQIQIRLVILSCHGGFSFMSGLSCLRHSYSFLCWAWQ